MRLLRTTTIFALLFTTVLLITLSVPAAMRSSRAQQQSAPTITELRGIQDGGKLSGIAAIEAIVSGTNISQVVFRVAGPAQVTHTEYIAPYFFMGDTNGTPRGWDTTKLPDGDYTLNATVIDKLSQRSERQVHFHIANTAPPNTEPTATPPPTPESTPASAYAIYGDSLASGWVNWSWNSAIDFAAPASTQGGTASIAVTYKSAWAAMYIHSQTPISTTGYDALRFWIHGGTSGGQQLRMFTYDSGNGTGNTVGVATPLAGVWTKMDVPLNALGNPDSISGIAWQDIIGSTQPTFYIDSVALVKLENTLSLPEAGPALSVDVSSNRRPISPLIYGMNFPDEALAADLRLPIQRWGGNATTRYNWQNDTSNRAGDWFYENIPNKTPDVAALPNGSASDRFLEQGQRTGTATLLTVPMIGWTPKSRDITCGFAVSKYGAQQKTDPYRKDCGNGVASSGKQITGNDPHDTSAEIGPDFVQAWLQHLTGRYGTAARGGARFYNLDNEPSLWHINHRDVHPQPVSYDELRDRSYVYGAAVKAIDPSAQTLGPAEWGWTSYFYSAADQAAGGSWWSNSQDRNAHGGLSLVPWYLQQMQTYEQQHGTRILDYLDLHYYPQGSGVALSSAGTGATQALRLRSTRSLWDASYRDESWINETVNLIPRMRGWVDQNYPGTKLAITEYNWGALYSMNGALAQADVLGIFGREGLDLATLWSPPKAEQPGAFAFRMYLNYDGQGSAFGGTSVHAASADADRLAVYAAQRDDGTLTVMVVNKSETDLASTVTLAGVNPKGSAQAYRYSTADLHAITRQPDVAMQSNALTATFPRNSITLLVIHQ